MDLLIALGIVGVYVLGAGALMVRAHRWAAARGFARSARIGAPLAVLLTALAIPLGDHLIGWLYFRYLCEREAGERIYRTVENVEGFLWQGADPDTLRRLGYRFIETSRDALFVRYEIEEGNVVEIAGPVRISQFSVVLEDLERLSLGVARRRLTIRSHAPSEVLASYTTVAFNGGWLFRSLLLGYGGTFGACPEGGIQFDQFVRVVLQPSRRGG